MIYSYLKWDVWNPHGTNFVTMSNCNNGELRKYFLLGYFIFNFGYLYSFTALWYQEINSV